MSIALAIYLHVNELPELELEVLLSPRVSHWALHWRLENTPCDCMPGTSPNSPHGILTEEVTSLKLCS